MKNSFEDWISDPRRARSEHKSYGMFWKMSDDPITPWYVVYIKDTGEMYAAEVRGDPSKKRRWVHLGDIRAEKIDRLMRGWNRKEVVFDTRFGKLENHIARRKKMATGNE